jgi:hypothetical protein
MRGALARGSRSAGIERNALSTMVLQTTIDLTHAQAGAEAIRTRLLALRKTYNVAPFEYCKSVCIAPYVLPHSHPVVTLNTYFPTDMALLSTYVHEQMHWYATWHSHRHTAKWLAMLAEVEARHPNPPIGGADGASDRYSSHLHLIVNWLEVEAMSTFMDRAAVEAHVSGLPYYRALYASVLRDGDTLRALYVQHSLFPIRTAYEMTADDLALAARMDEARPEQ